ncbi:MAG: hypothetical protein ACHBNF_21600, partial [Chromatiales bacterium]
MTGSTIPAASTAQNARGRCGRVIGTRKGSLESRQSEVGLDGPGLGSSSYALRARKARLFGDQPVRLFV